MRIEDGATLVAPQANGACGANHCATQACGTALLTQLFSRQPRILVVDNPIAARVGERVVVGLQPGVFLKTALVVYLLPLCALLVGAAFGLFWAGHSEARDLYAALGGLIGLASSGLALKIFAPILFPHGAQPIILRRL